MEALPKRWIERDRSASGVVLLGIVLVVLGIALRDTTGVLSTLAALGLALVVAGTTYAIADGEEPVRLALAFASLVAVQLLAFGGVLRLVGGIAVASVVLALGSSRR